MPERDRAWYENAAQQENIWVRARLLKPEYKDHPEQPGPLAERAARMAKDNLGERHPAYAVALLNLGIYHAACEDDPIRAEEFFKQAAAIIPEDHREFGEAMYWLGICYFGPDWKRAAACFERALRVREHAGDWVHDAMRRLELASAMLEEDTGTGKGGLISVLRRTTGRHTKAVLCVAFRPDGLQVLSTSSDRTIRIWDVGSGREMTVLKGHEAAVWTAAFSPDGRTVLSGSDDKTLRLWDAETGRESACWRGHDEAVKGVCFSPDGRAAVSASRDEFLRLWEVPSGKELAVWNGESGSLRPVAFSPDGTRILSGGSDTLKIWDAKSRSVMAVCQGHEDTITSAVFSPDGKWILSGSWDQNTILWDAATGQFENSWEDGDAVFGVTFDGAGRFALSACGNMRIPVRYIHKGGKEADAACFEADAVPTALAAHGGIVALGHDSETVADVWLLKLG